MSKTAFIYPGQGAQKAGMGADFYENCPEARELFDQAGEALGLDMAALCFEENDQLDLTEYTQAALVTTTLAMTRVVEKHGIHADMTAGLSLGEYSAIAAALASLKGPRHGGANIRVMRMFEDMKANIDTSSDSELKAYLEALVDGRAFDGAGLIYGIGHAVYSISDPRAGIFKEFVEKLAGEKGLHEEYELYARVEKFAPEIIGKKRKIYKGVSANVDFYSGFAYKMLNIPVELYTPIFAIARMAGWSAHRMEELVNAGKIIRPAYESVAARRDYVPLGQRK